MAEMMLDMGVEDEEQFERNRTRPHSRSLQESYQNLMVASREERAKAERHRMQRQAQIQLLQNSPKASDQEKAREVLRKRSGSSALLRASVKKMVAGKNAVSRINSLARSVSSSSPKARKASDFEDRPSSRIGQALKYPSPSDSMHEWSIPIDQMSLDTSLYRDACDDADVIWLPSDNEEEGRTSPAISQAPSSSTPAQMMHLKPPPPPPKSPKGRAIQGAPRGIGRHLKTPENMPSEELFTSLTDGKHVLSPHKYCTPSWVKAAQKLEQEMERSRSADPSKIWRPLSTAFDTELPEDSWAENWAGSTAAAQPVHRTRPPPSPWKVATKEHAINPRRAKSVAVVMSSTHHHHVPRPGSRCNTWESCKRTRIVQQTTRPISVQDFHRSWVPAEAEPARPATAVDFNSAAAWQSPPGSIVRPFSKSGSAKKPIKSAGPNQQALPAQPARPAPLPMASDMHQGSERFSMEKIQEDAMKHLNQRSWKTAKTKASTLSGMVPHHHPRSGGAPEAQRHSRLSQQGGKLDAEGKNAPSTIESGSAQQPSTGMQLQDEQGSHHQRVRLVSKESSNPDTERHQDESSPHGPQWNSSTQPSRRRAPPKQRSSILITSPASRPPTHKAVTMSMKDLHGHGGDDDGTNVVQRSSLSGTNVVQRSSLSGSSARGTPHEPAKVRNPLERSKSGVYTLSQIHPNGTNVITQKRLFRFSDEGVVEAFEGEDAAGFDFDAESDAPQELSGKIDLSQFGTAHSKGASAVPSTQPAPGNTAEVSSSPAQETSDAEKKTESKKRAFKRSNSVNVRDTAYVPYTMEQDEGDIPDDIPEEGDNEEEKQAALKRMLSRGYKEAPAVKPPEWLPDHIVHTPTWEWASGQRDGDLNKGSIPDPEKLKKTWKKEHEIVQAKNDDEIVKTEGRLEQACASKEYALEAAGGRVDQKAKSEFNGVLSIVRSSRAQFQLPERPKDFYKRIPTEARKKEAPKRTMHDSIFVRRLKECESKDFFDTEKVLLKGHDVDWARVVAKSRFRAFIARKDKNLIDPMALHRELQEVYDSLKKNLAIIRAAFFYYCMLGGQVGESAWSMTLNNWTSFAQECGIVEHSKSSPVNQTALDTLFITVNFEENKSSSEAKENDDRALMRFEWYEIIVRTAVSKYGGGRKTTDISDSVDMLIENNVKAFLPAEAQESSNEFRKERLYTFENDQLLQEYLVVLESMFAAYKAHTITNYFWMEHWMNLLEDCQLIGGSVGVSKFEAKLIFARAKMAAADEFKRRQRVISHMFIDFLEALVRLADKVNLPTLKELQEWMKSNTKEDEEEFTTPTNPFWMYCKKTTTMGAVPVPRSSEQEELPTHEKLKSLLDLMMGGLCEMWESTDIQRLCLKLDKHTHTLTRGRVKPTD